jgi:ketosteroid isomerase-like protein
MAEHDNDVALIRRWFQKLQLCIQTVDFVGSRSLFADDLITFGTYAAFTLGRAATEKEQWRHVWGHIDQFRWRLDDLRTIVSGDRLTAVGMAVFESTGYTEDGKAFDRPGRATVVLGRKAVGGFCCSFESTLARAMTLSTLRGARFISIAPSMLLGRQSTFYSRPSGMRLLPSVSSGKP